MSWFHNPFKKCKHVPFYLGFVGTTSIPYKFCKECGDILYFNTDEHLLIRFYSETLNSMEEELIKLKNKTLYCKYCGKFG